MASLPPTSSSSSTTLSAKARPFVPTQARPSPSLSTLSAKSAPFINPTSISSSSAIHLTTGTPYYASPDDLFDFESLGFEVLPSLTYADTGDDTSETSWTFEGSNVVNVGIWNDLFGGEEMLQLEANDGISSWSIPPSDYQNIAGGGYEFYEKNATVPHKIHAPMESALSKGVPQIYSSSFLMESCNCCSSNSSSNACMAQVHRCLTESVAYVPFSRCSTSATVCAPSAFSTSLTLDFVSKSGVYSPILPDFSTFKNVNGVVSSNGSRANRNINIKSGSFADSSTTLMEGVSSSSKHGHSMIKPIKLHKKLSTETCSDKHDGLSRNHSKEFSPRDLDVDSPCWKGTLSRQQSPFSVGEKVALGLNASNTAGAGNISAGDNDLVNDQKDDSTTSGYEKTLNYVQNDLNLTCDSTREVSSILDVQNKCNKPYTFEEGNYCKGIECLSKSKGQITNPANSVENKLNGNGKVLLLSAQATNVVPAKQPAMKDDTACPNDVIQNSSLSNHGYTVPSVVVKAPSSLVLSKKSSYLGHYTLIIDEVLQHIRERLLYLADKDENALMDILNQASNLVYNYPEGISEGSFHGVVGLSQSGTGTIELKGDSSNNCDINVSQDEEKLWIRSILPNTSDKFNTSFSDLNIKCLSDDFEKSLRRAFCNQDDPQSSVHKNLWIEAEVESFLMKLKLQLAYTEIETLNQSLRIKDKPEEVIITISSEKGPLKFKGRPLGECSDALINSEVS